MAIKTIHLDEENGKEAVAITNELYELLPNPKGSPHELARTLIVEEGRRRIDRLKAEKEKEKQ